jgi:uncharacterized protein with GYD domain
MGTFLFKASYTAAGAKGLLAGGGSARRKAIEQLVTAAGGTLVACYFAFGEDDVYVIADGISDADAAAISLTVGASGAVGITTVVLLTPEQLDEASKRSVAYTPPGG